MNAMPNLPGGSPEAFSNSSSHPMKEGALVRKLGFLWGFLFLLGGVLGFVPAITKDEMFLGFFMVNTPHNILHIISGTVFLIASFAGAKPARIWFYAFGTFYASLSLIGFWEGDKPIFNLISNNRIDSWGHGFLALVLLAIGFLNRDRH
jgi:hypothetical protein